MTTDRSADFLARLATGRPLLLDGATGTELDRRGVDTSLPLWSARALIVAPQVVQQIHRDYLDAGADIITTNTFRTHRRTLTRAGIGVRSRTRELTQLAVQLARDAVKESGRTAYIAGSMSPLEDCYSPQLVPPDAELRAEHFEMAQDLAEAGCDLLLVETMNSIREAAIAAECAGATGLPVCVSFVIGPHGRPPDQSAVESEDVTAPMTLLSGESITAAVAALTSKAAVTEVNVFTVVNTLSSVKPAVIMVNCVPLAYVDRAFDELRAAFSGPIGLYANVGHADDVNGWTLTDDVQPLAYAQHAQRWIEQGAAIVGGCCGTSPAHIEAIRKQVDKETRTL